MGKKTNIKRTSKAEWLDAALNALEEGGIDAVRIERLAKKLGTSRSGFYWHFRNLDNLKNDILEYWKYEFTDVVVQNYSTVRNSPEANLTEIADMIAKLGLNRHDLSIREWGKNDAVAEAVVTQVDKVRMDYIRSLFSALGFKGDDLEMSTMLYVSYHTWENSMFSALPETKRAKLLKLRLKLLIHK